MGLILVVGTAAQFTGMRFLLFQPLVGFDDIGIYGLAIRSLLLVNSDDLDHPGLTTALQDRDWGGGMSDRAGLRSTAIPTL